MEKGVISCVFCNSAEHTFIGDEAIIKAVEKTFNSSQVLVQFLDFNFQ